MNLPLSLPPLHHTPSPLHLPPSPPETLAGQVQSNDGVYFVPAFTGLYAPHWDPTARGTLIGLTQSTSRSHIARAALESICYRTREVGGGGGGEGEKGRRFMDTNNEEIILPFLLVVP